MRKDNKLSLKNLFLFILGFALAFLVLAFVFVWLNTTGFQELIRFVAAGVLALLGLRLLFKGLDISWMENWFAKIENPFLFGLVFGLAINPCALPLFIANLALSTINAFDFVNILLFGLGVATPPLLAAIFGSAFIKHLAKNVRGMYQYLDKIVGVFLLIASAIMMWNVAADPKIAVVGSLFLFTFFILLSWPFIRYIRTSSQRCVFYLLSSFLFFLWAVVTFHCYRVSYTTRFACNTFCAPCQICVLLLVVVFALGYIGFYLLEKQRL